MAAIARRAEASGCEVVVVVGQEHAAALPGWLENERNVRRVLEAAGVEPSVAAAQFEAKEAAELAELLAETEEEHPADELEKRAAVAAMLVSTNAGDPAMVLPPAEVLAPEDREKVAEWYPKYRELYATRLSQALDKAGPRPGGEEEAAAAAAAVGVGARGLHELAELCRGGGGGAVG
eukprot:SAG22_NODE_1439_length_4416_cov_25.417940_3_plen_178_part_00